MIHAMICALVFTSGRGHVPLGPNEIDDLGGIAPRQFFELRIGEHVRVDNHAAFAAAEGNVDDGAFPSHPRSQRADFVKRHIGRETNTAFGRTARDGMLHAISGEDFNAAIVEQHRDMHGNLSRRRAQHLAHAVIDLEKLGGFVETGGSGKPGIFFVVEGNRNWGSERGHAVGLRFNYRGGPRGLCGLSLLYGTDADGLARNHHIYTAVLLAAGGRIVRRHRVALTQAGRGDGLRGYALRHDIRSNRIGALLREFHIIVIRPDAIRVPFQLNLETRIGQENSRYFGEFLARAWFQGVLVEIEEHVADINDQAALRFARLENQVQLLAQAFAKLRFFVLGLLALLLGKLRRGISALRVGLRGLLLR